MGTILCGEHAFRTISTSLLYHARANPEFREGLRRALGVKGAVGRLVLDRQFSAYGYGSLVLLVADRLPVPTDV